MLPMGGGRFAVVVKRSLSVIEFLICRTKESWQEFEKSVF